MSDNSAILAGFTKEVIATGGGHELHLFVRPQADLSDRFTAYDADECCYIRVNGWLFTIEPVEE